MRPRRERPDATIAIQRLREYDLAIPRDETTDEVLSEHIWQELSFEIDQFYKRARFSRHGVCYDIQVNPDVKRSGTPRHGFVYLLRLENPADPDIYKIGRTKDLDQRFKPIALQLPYPVTLVWAWMSSDVEYAEAFLHATYEEQRLNGEWFRLEEADIQWLVGLKQIEPPIRYLQQPTLNHVNTTRVPIGGAAAGHKLHGPLDFDDEDDREVQPS